MCRFSRYALVITFAVVCSLAAGVQGKQQLITPDTVFEVASIKRSLSPQPGTKVSITPGNFSLINAPVSLLLFSAYDLDDAFQLVDAPEWISATRYDVIAKPGRTLSLSELGARGEAAPLRMMVRHLLVERFNFRGYTEERPMPAYDLVRARADGAVGPTLRTPAVDCGPIRAAADRDSAQQPSRPGGPPRCGIAANAQWFAAGSIPIGQFISLFLAPRVQRPVMDQTSLAGEYELSITFAPDDAPVADRSSQGLLSDPSAPALRTALEEQLGLKLVSTRRPVRVLIVERIDAPTPD